MALDLIFNANSPTQSKDGPLVDFDTEGTSQDQDFVRGDRNLALSLRPVVPSVSGAGRPWDDDYLPDDTFEVAISNPDLPPRGGDWPLGLECATITTNSVANPTAITTDEPHGLSSGNKVYIVDNIGSTPSINGLQTVTVTGANTFTIPVNVTVSGAGGKVYDATDMTDLAFDISAEDLQTLLSAISQKHGFSAVSVELLAVGNYQAEWAGNGVAPLLYSPLKNDLIPVSKVTVLTDAAGDAETQGIQIIFLKQSAVAFAMPVDPFPDPEVEATIAQAGSAADPKANKIYEVSMTPGTYDGTYIMSMVKLDASTVTIGVIAWDISASDLQARMVEATGLTQSEFVITRVNDILTIEFAGAYGNSNAPGIAVTNKNLVAPKGVKGTIQLNTISLYRAFLQVSSLTLDFTLAVRRQRASGEDAEIFQHVVTLKRNIIDVVSMIPVPLPTYLTEAQSDARYAKIMVPGIRQLPDNGDVIVSSPNAALWKIGVSNEGEFVATTI